MKSNKVYRKLK